MKSSMRRASFEVMYCSTSKSLTWPPKRTGKADTSKRVMGPIPLCPLRMASHADTTVLPTGETIPRPVTTTRRLLTRYLYETRMEGARGARAPSNSVASGLGAPLVDVLDGLMDRRDLLGVLIGNLDLEFLLEGHDELNRIERIGPEIVDERGIVRDLFLFDA